MRYWIAAAGAATMLGAWPAAAASDRAEAAAEAGTAHQVGRCILAAGRETAGRVLARLPIGGGVVEAEARALIEAAGCGPVGRSASEAMLIRGAIAQQLYLTDFREFGIEPRNRGSWIDLALPVESAAGDGSDATARLYEWADCVVRNDTGATERLLRTPPSSRQETAVLQGMQPYMSACLDPDARLVVAPAELRSVFAQSAYNTLYRYWSGELRQAGMELGRRYAAGGSGDLQAVSCRRFSVAGSRVRTVRFCLTELEWRKVASRNREWLYEMTKAG